MIKSASWLLLALTWIFVASAGAHGTGYRLEPALSAFTVRFYYSGGEPMAYAQVNIQGPGHDLPEHQNGRTDCNGVFAFCPDLPGTWMVTVNDGRGHRVRAKIDVSDSLSPAGSTPQDPGAGLPRWPALIAGISLLLNVWLIIGILKRSPPGTNP